MAGEGFEARAAATARIAKVRAAGRPGGRASDWARTIKAVLATKGRHRTKGLDKHLGWAKTIAARRHDVRNPKDR